MKYKGIEVQLEEYMIGVISCLPSPAGIVGGGSTDVGSFLFAACLGHDTDASFCSAGPSFLYIALSVLVVSLSLRLPLQILPSLCSPLPSSANSFIALPTSGITPRCNARCALRSGDNIDLFEIRTHPECFLPPHPVHYPPLSSPIHFKQSPPGHLVLLYALPLPLDTLHTSCVQESIPGEQADSEVLIGLIKYVVL